MRCRRSRDISCQICSKIARSRLPRPCLSAYISGTRARIGQRFSPLDRVGPEISKNVVKKISRSQSSQSCSKIARSRLPRPCLSAYISGTRARIGQRFSPLDRAGPEVSKNVVKKISHPNSHGRDLRKVESVYLRIAVSTRSAVAQKESPEH